jgi:transcriptional regulator with XRE-family HTH domain
VLKVEDWAEIRRLNRAEGVPIREIARRLGISRNTVRAAPASDRPPKYQRRGRLSLVDSFEPQVRALLKEWPKMPAPEIAVRIKWPHSLSPLKKRPTLIRPEHVGMEQGRSSRRAVHIDASKPDMAKPSPGITVTCRKPLPPQQSTGYSAMLMS